VNWLDFLLNFIIFFFTLLLAVLGGYVTTEKPKYRMLFVVIGALSLLIFIPSQIRAYHTAQQTEQTNHLAVENLIKLLQAQGSMQQDQRSLQGVAQNLMVKIDSLTYQASSKSTAKRASLKSALAVSITFKDSALFTPGKKAFISDTIAKLREYFIKLTIPVPAETVPIGVFIGKKWTINRSARVTYLGQLMLGSESLHDEGTIIGAYSDFVIQEMLRSSRANKGDLRIRAGKIISTYYRLSFRNKKEDHENDAWDPVLWSMRDQFGRQYMDNMVAFTLKLVCAEPSQGCSKLQRDGSEIESFRSASSLIEGPDLDRGK